MNGLNTTFGASALSQGVHGIVSANRKNRIHAFTILELLVAMAVFSLLIVMLMGMVDSGTKLWRESENRVDSYRESRAAISIIARDLRNTIVSTNTNFFQINSAAFDLLATQEKNTNTAGAVFFLSAQPSAAQDSVGNTSDICQVGYFLAFGNTSMIPGPSARSSMNLYRYFLSSDATFSRLTNSAQPIFPNSLQPSATDERIELLARNIRSFRITALQADGQPFTATPSAPLPPLIEVEMEALNDDSAKRLTGRTDWVSAGGVMSNTINRSKQTFSTRINLTKDN